MWKKGRTASRAAGASLWCSLLPRVLVISISAKSQIGRMIAAHSNFKGDEMQGGRVVKIKARHPWGDATVPADEVAEGLFSCALTGGPWEHSPTAGPRNCGARTPSLVPAGPDVVAVCCFLGVSGVVAREGEASQSAGHVAGS